MNDYRMDSVEIIASRIGLEPWEAASIIQTCEKKNCVDKMIGFMIEYQSLQHRFTKLLKRQSSNIASLYEAISQHYPVGESIGQLAVSTGKLLFVLSSMRKLQWTPKPVFLYPNESESAKETTSILLQEQLRQNARRLCGVILDSIKASGSLEADPTFGNIPYEHFAIILLEEFDAINDLIRQETGSPKPESRLSPLPPVDRKRFSDKPMENGGGVMTVTSNYLQISTCVCSLLKFEDKIYEFYAAAPAYNTYPLLRLPHGPHILPPPELSAWFEDTLPMYRQAKLIILGELQSGSLRSHSKGFSSPGSSPTRLGDNNMQTNSTVSNTTNSIVNANSNDRGRSKITKNTKGINSNANSNSNSNTSAASASMTAPSITSTSNNSATLSSTSAASPSPSPSTSTSAAVTLAPITSASASTKSPGRKSMIGKVKDESDSQSAKAPQSIASPKSKVAASKAPGEAKAASGAKGKNAANNSTSSTSNSNSNSNSNAPPLDIPQPQVETIVDPKSLARDVVETVITTAFDATIESIEGESPKALTSTSSASLDPPVRTHPIMQSASEPVLGTGKAPQQHATTTASKQTNNSNTTPATNTNTNTGFNSTAAPTRKSMIAGKGHPGALNRQGTAQIGASSQGTARAGSGSASRQGNAASSAVITSSAAASHGGSARPATAHNFATSQTAPDAAFLSRHHNEGARPKSSGDRPGMRSSDEWRTLHPVPLSKTRAARRIQLWFRRILPKTFKKFLKRRTSIKITKDILFDCIDAAVIKGLANAKLRKKWDRKAEKIRIRLMKERAAMIIQRMMRRWYYPRLLKKKRAMKQRRERNKAREAAKASKALAASGNAGGGANNSGGGTPQQSSITKMTRIDSTSSINSKGKDINKAMRIDSHMRVSRNDSTQSTMSHLSKEEEPAPVAEKTKEPVPVIEKPKRIFKDKAEAGLLIQRCLRGCMARHRTYKRISSAMRIQGCWRKYAALINLQQSVRRVERPLNINIKSLSNIPGTFITEGTRIKVKISIWWHPLLHILYGDKDVDSFLAKEKPQISWISPQIFYTCAEGKEGINVPGSPTFSSGGDESGGGIWDQISKSIPRSALGIVQMMRKKPKDGSDEEESSDSDSENEDESSSKNSGAFKDFMKFVSKNFAAADKARRKSSSVGAANKRLVCDFANMNLKIPACHGNSVIRFEFLTCPGDKKFCYLTFCTRKEDTGSMLYWGGEYQRNVIDSLARKARPSPMQVKGRNINSMKAATSPTRGKRGETVIDKDAPLLTFTVVSGRAGVSRADTVKLKVIGNGEVAAAMRRRGFMESMLSHWFTFFISLDHDGLRLLNGRRSVTAFYVIDVINILEVRSQLGTKIVQKKSGGKGTDDSHDVVVTLATNEELYLRFCDVKSRYNWLDTLEKVVQKNEDRPREIKATWREAFKASPHFLINTNNRRNGSDNDVGGPDAGNSSRKSIVQLGSSYLRERTSILFGLKDKSASSSSSEQDTSSSPSTSLTPLSTSPSKQNATQSSRTAASSSSQRKKKRGHSSDSESSSDDD